MDATKKNNSPLDVDEFLVKRDDEALKVRFQDDVTVTLPEGKREDFAILGGSPSSGEFSLLFRNTVFHISGKERDVDDDPTRVSLRINGVFWDGIVDDKRSLLAKRFSAAVPGTSGEVTITAPMPGLVLRVLVKPGDEVKRGDGLVILEAMKMENEVRADHGGRIVRIACVEGSPVEKRSQLLTIHYEH